MKFGLRAVFGFFVLLGIVFIVYSTMRQVREGEFNLYASTAAIVAISDFAIAKRAWPASLEELEKEARFQGFYNWPKDSDAILSRVEIEFGLSVKEVLSRGKDNFVVRPKGRLPQASYEAKVDKLIRILEEILRDQEGEKEMENRNKKTDSNI